MIVYSKCWPFYLLSRCLLPSMCNSSKGDNSENGTNTKMSEKRVPLFFVGSSTMYEMTLLQ